ncbi:hypothetical protein LNQ49_23105 [Flavobacterium sp. F-65]|uniref:Ig-like domain-containing protein n=1 Tax=Flavobacterium pisciphilum TaxID=2893755 RepID=A0ABS8N0B0_9FLAO|nr:FISUMP domain-containing protein [Flavobacterium sp. F-65]MCC9074483.1 hypothetical protein [Flavobacterium sp. F-65]
MEIRMRFLVILLLLLPVFGSGQTVIGELSEPMSYSLLELSTATIKGGIRMPQLTTIERDNLTTQAFVNDRKAKGLTIYNLDTKCMEYWNVSRWVSLCTGNADISFTPNDPTQPSFPSDGGKIGPFTPVEAPPCTGKIPYTYIVLTGSEFTTIDVTNNNTGAFTINMSSNPTAIARTAIVRIMNNCTAEYKEFLFTQEGNTDLCNVTVAKPAIAVSNGGNLCSGGAVYMEVTNAKADANYIWTVNNIIQGEGTHFRATEAGTYKVYVGAVGCDKLSPNSVSDDVIITLSSGTSPSNPIVLSASNNGIICGAAGEVLLTAYNVPKSSVIAWYKDGKRTNKTGNSITLKAIDEGDWFVVIEDNSCSSLPSKEISIRIDPSSNPLKKPIISINGKPLAQSNIFCSNGRLKLELSNPAGDYTTAVTVKWYNGSEYLGEGKELTITAPSTGNDFALSCIVSDNTGVLCSSEFTETKTLQGNAPATPVISASPPLICGSSNAQLAASLSGGGPYTFQWYKEGELLKGQTEQTLSVSKIGSYQVEAINQSGCISPLSTAVLVGLSDFPNVTWKSVHDKAELNQTKIFQVSDTFNPKTYTWTADNGASIENGQGTNTVRIQFPSTAAIVKVGLIAENDCGISNELIQEVTVETSCVPVAIKKIGMSSDGTILAGNSVTMSVLAEGSNTATAPITYQWKLNGNSISGATSSIYTVNDLKATNSGTYSCVVNNCSNIAVEKSAGTITVLNEEALPEGSGTMAGENCFDIAASNDNTKCGLLALRTANKADFSKWYTYTFTSTGAKNTDLTFVINDPEKAIEKYEVQNDIPASLVNGATYTVKIKYKESLLTSSSVIGRDNDNPVKVTIVALFKTGAIESKSKLEITIKDCECCSGVIDYEGNRYTAKRFGDACWMTQNLRSTVNKNGQSLGTVYLNPGNGAIAVTNTNGALNTGTVTYEVNNTKITESRKDFASKFGLLYGSEQLTILPCPAGWHLPKQAEWTALFGFLVSPSKKMRANDNSYKAAGNNTAYNWGGYAPNDSNNSGFNALPAGSFNFRGAITGFSSHTQFYYMYYNTNHTWVIINYNSDVLKTTSGYGHGGSIRCVKD